MSGRSPVSEHRHIEEITDGHHRYRVRMGGTADGPTTRDPVGYGPYGQAWEPNLLLSLENTGDGPVIDPWVRVSGKRSWRSVAEILAEVIRPGMSEAEKARAIWEFARRHRYHHTTADDEVKDPVKMLNVYGYTLCWDEAYTVANLWQAAGLRIRRGVPHGHCTTEVWFDGRFHLLDSDEHLLILLRDNETIADEEDLARDHDLVKRAHVYGILNPESRRTSEQAASLFLHCGPRVGGRPVIGGHCMKLILRPGEALIWEWADRGRYHGHGGRPPRLSNGRLRFVPRLDLDFARWTETAVNLRAAAGDGLTTVEPDCEAVLVYRMESPYVVVGGRVEAVATGAWSVEFSRDGSTWFPVDDEIESEAIAPTPTESRRRSLDPLLPSSGPAVYRCWVRLRGVNLTLTGLAIELDLQMAPLSLPALELGENEVEYEDEGPGPRQVRLTHRWQEREDLPAPPAPVGPVFPTDCATVVGTRPAFAWEPVPGAADYHFELGSDPDLRQVLSPSFERLISRTAQAGSNCWQPPEDGLLTPGRTYYWRVRARSAQGRWSGWSPVWRFTPQAPAVPLDPRLEVDREARRIVLRWTPGDKGTAVDHYEVHGSDEPGFTASLVPSIQYLGHQHGDGEAPATLLGQTSETSLVVVGPDLHEGQGNRAFYRVVAVDADGVRSGASDLVEAPRPFICSTPPGPVVLGSGWVYQVRVLRSSGDLRCISDGPDRYRSAIRDGDELRFLLDEAPEFVFLDERRGVMTADPGPEHLGYHTVTFRVQSNQGGTEVQGFDLLVVAGPGTQESADPL